MIRKDIRMCLQEIDSMRKKNNKTITAIGMAALLTAAGTDLGQHYECEWKQH